jgi:NADPH-dependent glutamate synthase beta subunit-like oxidoreductase/glutamate synthase domain-containing protein 3/NAD-dependent dihydropyrimidine dehydrogenase PreA subunit
MPKPFAIQGIENGIRVESRVLEEKIQNAVSSGKRSLLVNARGQHGIGGRLWAAGDETVLVRIDGASGQRVGAMGFPNTRIEVNGPASDDTGWLNAGALIVVNGNAANGCGNAMAQGKIQIAGSIGARGMTMTKANPRFAPPQLWVLGSTGDYFAEFMAGGIAVICGFEPQTPGNILGYRPCVGMVRGQVFFRGPIEGFSEADAKLIAIDEKTWAWLTENLKAFLKNINRPDLFKTLAVKGDWQLIEARSAQEKLSKPRRSLAAFQAEVWDAELGRGGMIGDIIEVEKGSIGLTPTGNWRRFVPVWENRKYTPPCQASCPTGIPVQERWRLIRENRLDEAIDLALSYTPFPATVCGYLCPNLCMAGCSRSFSRIRPVDVAILGKASIAATPPPLPPISGGKVAVIGGGAAGLSAAWHLRRAGHRAILFDTEKTLGGKISAVIPESRIPKDVLSAELNRVKKAVEHIQLKAPLTPAAMQKIVADHDYVVIATGAGKPRLLDLTGGKRAVAALDFLKQTKTGAITVGKSVVVIGAGNVGCDVATEAKRLGAQNITLIDIQTPAAFGKEKEHAQAAGAKFLWPCFTKRITAKAVELTNGQILEADNVVVAIGDMPELTFLPPSVETAKGFVKVDASFQTTDPKIFAIGDAVQLGLLTDAIGAGRKAAAAIDAKFAGRQPEVSETSPLNIDRVKLEYFDPRTADFNSVTSCADSCASCGVCRDCGICESVCPTGAISRKETADSNGFEMVVDDEKCIGCGFCTGSCPCGIWTLTPNTPMLK